jgi:hypothetical protein
VSSQTGAICLDILKDQWSPALTVKTALISLQALMCAPEPSDPQDAEVANMYLRNREQFLSTAKFWTESYAMDPSQVGEAVSQELLRQFIFIPHCFRVHFHCILIFVKFSICELITICNTYQVHPAVRRLMDMGFAEAAVRQALIASKGDENAAVEALLTTL